MRRSFAVVAVAPAVAVACAAVLALAGCAPLVEQPVACASWVLFESDAERAAASDAVVVVTDVEADGTASVLGFAANAYRVTVVSSEKGELEDGETIRVASTADNCAAEPYGDGDPMLAAATMRLYLEQADGLWRTITPFDGVGAVE